MKAVLNKLYQYVPLSRKEAKDILIAISQEKYNESLMTSFISSFQMRDISVAELQGFVDALLELRRPVDLSEFKSIDVCGTGGDYKNTFNISTLSAFVIAGANYKVAKHGNYGVSSSSGSSNVLEHLGYRFTNDEQILKAQLDKSNICFFHAPLFHPAMKAVGPIRKQLKMVTFFNMIGPLVNPAQPEFQMTGVFSRKLARLYQYIFQSSNKSYLIVHGLDGYDEVSLTGPFLLKSNRSERVIHPTDLGYEILKPQELYGGETVPEAAKIFTHILEGQGTKSQNQVVTVNAALGIHCFNPDWSLADCIAQAAESLHSGNALSVLKSLIK